MTQPTPEQLRDPQWWDENAPSDAQYYSHYHGAFAKNVAFHDWLVWKPGGPKPSAPWKEVEFMDVGIFVSRPKPQPAAAKPESQEWVDGLPPVGAEVEIREALSMCAYRSRKGRVVGYDEEMGIKSAVCRVGDEYHAYKPSQLHPPKSPAERQREETIREAKDLLKDKLLVSQLDASTLEAVRHLYDAGLLRKGGE